MAIRIHGNPGHLIVDRWPQVSNRRDRDEYGDHGTPLHLADARAIYAFFEQHVSLQYTVRQLYLILKRNFPEWDDDQED